MTIQRYTPVKRHVDFNPTQDGSWMLYSDHLAAIAAYEARLAEDAKVRAQLFHALDNLYAMVNGECPSLLEDDHHDGMVRAALAAFEGER